MKRTVYITILLLGLANAASAGAQENYGYLTIAARSRVEEILVDDSIYVRSDRIQLPAGTHRMVVQNPNRASFQALDFAKTITIRPGQEERVEVIFELLSEINSYPSGASVSFDAGVLGVTPFYLLLSDYKSRILQFKKPGYEDYSVEVMDSTIERNYLYLKLHPKTSNRRNNQNQFVNLEWQERGPHKYKNAIWISNGLGIVFGAGAAYYKKKADDAFENAKIARRLGDIQARAHYLSKTRKYDRYAVIGFIGMQTNVAALVYFLFKSR